MDPSTPPLDTTTRALAKSELRDLESRSDTELATIRAYATQILASRREAAAARALRDLLQPPHPPQGGPRRALVQPDRPRHVVLHYDTGATRTLTLNAEQTRAFNAAIAGLNEVGAEMIAGRLLISMSPLSQANLACAVCDASSCGAPDNLPDGRCAGCEAHLHHEHRLTAVNCSAFVPF
ncbi:hypothetical protein PUR49_32600 [Streptomyces sp. BE147]|uniref:hypothetical protein n=1 Tax=Streptomyces sp. BE147 TaxID=3002524 RepID=UPI002E7852ED|nr:hypothetical protein [Streptomyces sp. BE147]MEE1741213.1 hypothetical protein [Streptomyces sp. BE147]